MDILGKAICDFWKGDRKSKLWVHDHLGPRVEMKRAVYFREWKEMPIWEQKAIELCSGKILDVGAGAGAHSLALQNLGKDVTALDISPLNCEVMKSRGIVNVLNDNFFELKDKQWDTLLFLMNGVGISGDLNGFRDLLECCDNLLVENGQIIMDSSDLSYLYDEELPMPEDRYYGEVDCAYSYKGEMTEVFTWLYLDFSTLRQIAASMKWKVEKVIGDEDDQFLVRLTRNYE